MDAPNGNEHALRKSDENFWYKITLKKPHKDFADEAFKNFSDYDEVSRKGRVSILHTAESPPKSCNLFTHEISKAVAMISFLHRNTFHKKFRKILHRLQYAENVKILATSYTIDKDNYFEGFLGWVAFIFELAAFCYMNGYGHIETCRTCLASYSDYEHFDQQGGWNTLTETAERIAILFNPLLAVCSTKDLDIINYDIVAPYRLAINVAKRRCKYDKWMEQIKQKCVSECKQPSKFQAILNYDVERIRFGYIVKKICRAKVKKILEETPGKSQPFSDQGTLLNVESEKENFILKTSNSENAVSSESLCENDKNLCHVNKMCSPETAIGKSHSTSVTTITNLRNCSFNFSYKKSIFIISDNYLEKRKQNIQETEKLQYKRDIKIYSPSKEEEIQVKGMKEILDENIKDNLMSVGDGVSIVYPQGWNVDCHDNRIVILDTSSEEEDDDRFNHEQQLFAIELAFAFKARKKRDDLKSIKESLDKKFRNSRRKTPIVTTYSMWRKLRSCVDNNS